MMLAVGASAEVLAQSQARYDVCVYGGTSSGVIAAVQANRMGKSVILISPTKYLGGLSSGGLGFTDMGDERTVGGMSREYFHRIWEYYQKPEAWKFQPRETFRSSGQHGPAFNEKLEIGTVFEPHVAERLFDQVLAESGVELIRDRLDRSSRIVKSANRIASVRMESGKEVRAGVFIDATYEGDLMAEAGVTYTVGREANSQYDEKANGIQKGHKGNQLPKGIDPHVIKGDPTSGLLPRVNANAGGENGAGDKRVQAYCYRMCLTDVPTNRIQVEKPPGYRDEDYELLFRAIEDGQKSRFFKFSLLPNRKTDSNNDSGISTDYIGMSDDYPEADYATRVRIEEAHKNWQLGLIWTLQNHPRVPESIRQSHAKWGLPKDEFVENGHWSPQLYVREARRLVNDHVIDENAILKRTTGQSVGMGSYKMDSHHTQYHVADDGFVIAEGDVQKAINGPYEIDYRALTPKEDECANLIVPVCLAASHIAYGSIRMESVFMILGQSAGTAAALAVEGGTSVQQVPYGKLKNRLEQDGQILKMPASSRPSNGG
jgi:hypothetical protein